MKRLLEAKFTGFGHLFRVLIWGWGKREQNESQVSTRGHAINQKMQGMESRKPELSFGGGVCKWIYMEAMHASQVYSLEIQKKIQEMIVKNVESIYY